MTRPQLHEGFARADLLALVAAMFLLVCVGVGATSRDQSKRAVCHNNLRQLGVAMLEYAEENGGKLPARRLPAWPVQLLKFYRETRVLLCPADGPSPATFDVSTNADAAPRSYIANGWSDYFMARNQSFNAAGMPIDAIIEPAQTILFGEKYTPSGHSWVDISAWDDLLEVENARHGNASNHTLADGSVRLIPFGAAFEPTNLWAVEPAWRANYGIIQP
jgi:hypothetical protein